MSAGVRTERLLQLSLNGGVVKSGDVKSCEGTEYVDGVVELNAPSKRFCNLSGRVGKNARCRRREDCAQNYVEEKVGVY